MALHQCPVCNEEISYWSGQPCVVCMDFLDKLYKGNFDEMTGKEILDIYKRDIQIAVEFAKNYDIKG